MQIVLKRFSKALTANSLLWGIVLAGLLLRIGAAFYHGNAIKPLPGVTDQISYHQLALRVIEGKGFSFATGWWPATPANQPTAHWSFLYVLYLSGVYLLFGPVPIVARLIQAVVVGILQPWLAWRIGGRIFGPRVGVIAAALTSFYAYFLYYAGALVTESFYIVAVLWSVDIALALAAPSPPLEDDPSGKIMWVKLGLAFGLASLLRQVILPVVPVVLGWITWRLDKRDEVRPASALIALKRVSICVATLAFCILPWTIRNYSVFGQFVLLNTNAGYAFFAGNHPIYGTDFVPILPGPGSRYAELLPEGISGLNEAQLERELLSRGIMFVMEDPIRYVLLSASRMKEYFKFWPTSDSSLSSNLARILSFGLMFPFLLSGVFLSVFRRRNYPERIDRGGILLILLFAGTYTLMHLMTWTLVRYRLPIDAMALPFAAFAIVYAYDRLNGLVRVSSPVQIPAD